LRREPWLSGDFLQPGSYDALIGFVLFIDRSRTVQFPTTAIEGNVVQFLAAAAIAFD